MDDRITLSLIALAVGWGLSQLTDYIRRRFEIRKLKQALLTELEDIKDRLKMVRMTYERAIQIYALKGVDPSVPLPINNFLFTKHYSDVAMYLGASQRKSYELIHGYVEAINNGMKRLENTHASVTENLSEESFKNWGDCLIAQYYMAALASWHVNYHLANSDLPFLDEAGSDVHQAMLDQIKSSKEHVEKLIADARDNLRRDMFE